MQMSDVYKTLVFHRHSCQSGEVNKYSYYKDVMIIIDFVSI